GATAACPSPPTLYLGDGNDGPRMIDHAGTHLDEHAAALAQPAAGGGTSLALAADAGFVAGDEVAIIQMTGSDAGAFEIAHVARVPAPGEPPVIDLTAPLTASHLADASTHTQVVRVGNYTSVTVTATGSITANPWNET